MLHAALLGILRARLDPITGLFGVGGASFHSEGTWSKAQLASSVLGWSSTPGVLDRMNLECNNLGDLNSRA